MNKKNMVKVRRPEGESRSSDWIESLPWKNVTPDDSAAVLVGSDEGGFMCLEEVDGEFYSQIRGNNLDGKTEKNLSSEENLSSTGEVTALNALNCSTDSKSSKKRKRPKMKTRKETNHNVGEAEICYKGQIHTKKKKRTEKRTEEENTTRSDLSAGAADVRVPKTVEKNGCLKMVDHEQNVLSLEHVASGCKQSLNDLPAWSELGLHWKLTKAMATLGFTQPTPIQKSCIPAAARQRKDIIGAAETGSGKTLAFVIPILQRLLEEEERCYVSSGNKKINDGMQSRNNKNGSPLCALIVTPTRELALQVCDHFRAAAKYTDIKVVPIVGGISAQKQERLLKQRPQAVVGTPGRLWELMSAGEKHLVELDCLSFFILDEADRMVEKGHFQELQSIISMLPVNQESRNIMSDQRRVRSDCSIPKAQVNVDVGSPEGSTRESCCADADNWKSFKQRQTFVFSATLALPPGFRKKLKKNFLKVKESLKNEKWSVAALSERAGVRNNAAIFNLTSQNIVADKLEESIIQCREEEKDIYLYYILKLHGCGRAIVFCTSIAAVRRVAALLHLLQIPAWPLHGQMQQRQRFKAMDQFRAGDNSILVATDVAARGIDVQGIRTVIHYQLPHSAEVYVHRSGRTARASQDGCSVLLLCPSDQMKYNSLCRTLCKQDRLPIFPVNNAYMPAIVRRMEMANHVDSLLRKHTQRMTQESWFERNADALGMDIDDTGKSEKESDATETCVSGKRASIQLKKLQQELKCLLEQPLEPRSISHQFVTGAGISPLVAGQLKDFAKQKMFKRHVGSGVKSSKTGSKMGEGRKGLVVIGQETVEPLAALRTSFLM